LEKIKFDKQGLVPVVVQDVTTKQVLMLAYMNKEAYLKTIETKETWFYSRSRRELWHKGATSGNKQTLVSMSLDCDGDTLLVNVLHMARLAILELNLVSLILSLKVKRPHTT